MAPARPYWKDYPAANSKGSYTQIFNHYRVGRTPGEQSPRIFHGSKRQFRVVFRFELPIAVSNQHQKSLKTMDWLVGAVGATDHLTENADYA